MSGESRGASVSDNEMLYIWVALFSAYFFTVRQALRLVAWAALCYAATLWFYSPHDIIVTRWIETVFTLVVATGLFGLLKDRGLDGLIDRLADAARTDPLTNLLNRRGFEERLGKELSGRGAATHSLTVLVADLDHFKVINDRHGHRAGDDVLTAFATDRAEAKRLSDDMGRTGGEEFALVLPDTDEHGAFLLAERLRRRRRERSSASRSARRRDVPAPRRRPRRPAAPRRPGALLAKQLGRDRSVIYSDEVAGSMQAGDVERTAVEQTAAVLVLAETLDMRDAGTRAALADRRALLRADRGRARARGRARRARPARRAAARRRQDRRRRRDPAQDRPADRRGVRRDAQAPRARRADPQRREPRRPRRVGRRAPRAPRRPRLPAGLRGDEIPLEARILSVADTYEAMTSDRPYRAASPAGRAAPSCGAAPARSSTPRRRAFLAVVDRASDALALRS